MLSYYNQALRQYATFSGRARRAEYWSFTLVNALICFGLLVIGKVWPTVTLVTVIAMLLYGLATFLPGLAVLVRRLHDTGRSGWWVFITFVPYVGSLILLVFVCLPSTPGENTYGSVPAVLVK
jgi:uncharacterized membrane protein YhaH (DUF805 family)